MGTALEPQCVFVGKQKYTWLSTVLFLRRAITRLTKVPSIEQRVVILRVLHIDVGLWSSKGTLQSFSIYPGGRKCHTMCKYVCSCLECQLFLNKPSAQSQYKHPVVCIIDMFSMDFAVPLLQIKRKEKFLVVSVEHLTSCVLANPSLSQSVDAEIKFFMDKFLQRFCSPWVLWTDWAQNLRLLHGILP